MYDKSAASFINGGFVRDNDTRNWPMIGGAKGIEIFVYRACIVGRGIYDN